MTDTMKPAIPHWITGRITVPGERSVPRIATELTTADLLGGWRVRWGIGRMKYRVEPGLYAAGAPEPDSPVLVTANYKLTFDALRKELGGLDLWILVIDTRGVNVWCAAGKGTFGTEELVAKIEGTGLAGIVSHRTLILPQLGAPGIASWEVAHRTGFRVVYGPVRAADVKRFLENGMKADADMRRVRFDFRDRIVLVPMELSLLPVPAAIVLALSAVLAAVKNRTLDISVLVPETFGLLSAFLGAALTGAALVPALLPYIPGRPLALKGWLAGLLWAATVTAVSKASVSSAVFFMTVLPAVSSYLAMNFTGSTTYTSLSGVMKEMKFAVPALIASGTAGVLTGLAGIFLGF